MKNNEIVYEKNNKRKFCVRRETARCRLTIRLMLCVWMVSARECSANFTQCRLFLLSIESNWTLRYWRSCMCAARIHSRALARERKQLMKYWHIDSSQSMRTAPSVARNDKYTENWTIRTLFWLFDDLHTFFNLIFLFDFRFQALAGLVEIPAIAMAIFIIMCVGKKWILFSTMFCAGIACFCVCITFVDDSPSIQWLKISFLMLGKWPFTLLKQSTFN